MGYVHIMASRPFGTLYIGVMSDIVKRVWEHKHDVMEGFTKRYGCHLLVFYETHDSIESAILREKQMKKWNRNWKLRQIMDMNPKWHDLYDSITP